MDCCNEDSLNLKIDPCIFMKKGCICVVYVDGTICTGPAAGLLEQEIRSRRVASDECDHSFQLRDEGDVGDFLGIGIEKQNDNSFLLRPPFLDSLVTNFLVGQ
jgi:hypothetical protein